jgi:hypothetical protein
MALRRLSFAIAVLLLALPAAAQFIGYTSPQTVTSVPYNNMTCTQALAASPVVIPNVGQTFHTATLTSGALGATGISYSILGSYDGTVVFNISDVGTGTDASTGLTGVTASGYYPVVLVVVKTCTPASQTITIKYSGTSAAAGPLGGALLVGQLVKNISNGLTAGSSASLTVNSPFGSSAGILYFSYSGSGPASSTLTVQCASNQSISVPIFTSPSLVTTSGVLQRFIVPPTSCYSITVGYNSGGASSATFSLDYELSTPGTAPLAYQYSHIAATTATAVKAVSGFVHTVTVNTSAAGTVSIFDLAAASCTGTPSTNTVAVITTPSATTGLASYTFDVNTLNGICVQESAGSMDVTVSYY